MTGITRLERLLREWRELKGEEMPYEISSQAIEVVERAVKRVRAGEIVGVVKVREIAVESNHDSMMDWDKHGEF